jgi:hypothetical protein
MEKGHVKIDIKEKGDQCIHKGMSSESGNDIWVPYNAKAE